MDWWIILFGTILPPVFLAGVAFVLKGLFSQWMAQDLYQCFLHRRIYLDERLSRLIETMWMNADQGVWSSQSFGNGQLSQSEAAEKFQEMYHIVILRVDKVMRRIEKEFRAILGVSNETDESPD